MSYTKKTWTSGDTVTSSALNNIEGGIDDLQTFVVTLTPTSLDYSGTMDKTVAEIYAAWQAGKRIIYRVYSSETEYADVEVTMVFTDEIYTYPSFNAFIIMAESDPPVLIFAFTGADNDGTVATYGTTIYQLTPLT